MKQIQIQVIHRRLKQIKIDTLSYDYWDVKPEQDLTLKEKGKPVDYEIIEVTFLNWIKLKQRVQIIYID
jgi:hypothetical protein